MGLWGGKDEMEPLCMQLAEEEGYEWNLLLEPFVCDVWGSCLQI